MNDEEKRVLEVCDEEIDMISKWIDVNKFDSNVKYLVAYSVIKASGSIEIVLKSMIYTFLSYNCKEETKLYLEKNIINSSKNPSSGVIEKYLEQFAPQKKDIFLELLDSREKGELNSLVNLRNDIAHGRSISSSINQIKIYYTSGKNVLLKLERVLSGS